jgi:chromatin segregation and condensation protein Rec8/ScpA/Scc1 (kleisin family)
MFYRATLCGSMPDDPRPMTSDQMRAEAAELERVAKSYLERAKQLREVAALVDGLAKAPVDDSSLSRRHEYATIRSMSSTEIVAQTRKRRGPPSEGPVTNLAAELGYASMKELADALKEKEANLRSWNHRGSIPADRAAKIDKLRASRTSKTKRV